MQNPIAEGDLKWILHRNCEGTDLEYGAGLEQKSPEYIQAVREGLMHDKNGFFFGFRLAYDTQDNSLYCAEAVTRIIWHKSEALAIYSSELLKKLFFD